jgi:hypothetical protein
MLPEVEPRILGQEPASSRRRIPAIYHRRRHFPNPNGMSGGAVVQINETNPNDIRIIGIMNEWNIPRKNIVIATRIERYFDLFSSMKKIWLSPSPSWLGR